MNFRFLTARRSLPAIAAGCIGPDVSGTRDIGALRQRYVRGLAGGFQEGGRVERDCARRDPGRPAGVTLDNAVLTRDKSQKVFSQTFEEFSGRMIPPRMTRGSDKLKQYGSVLSRIEQTYGVPPEVIVAIWGLETDFGVNIGKFPTIRSLATLAYDCRRSDTFKAELMDALRIVERGDIAPQDLKGAWAGEIGQTQFMPSSYVKYAVDFDGNGHRDLLRSVPDVLASTANYLAGYGWQKGKDWQPGAPNFAVLQQWNKSEVYAKTIASFATQLAKAP